MKKQTTIKIISGLIMFVVFVFNFASPIQAATETSISNLYANPNQNIANNPYKFKISDVVSSGLLTNVVGCTGIVNKVSTWMTGFIQSPLKQAEMKEEKLQKVRAQLESTCLSMKAGTQSGAGSIPIINDLVSTVNTIFSKIKINVDSLVDKTKNLPDGLSSSNAGKSKEQVCLEQIKAINPSQLALMVKDAEKQNEIQLKEQCFDGIAITLAKNQLTAMTRSMMNWVNSGYGGNPFFVQNMRNFTNNLERNVLETGIDILLAPDNQNPYAYDFARSAITGRGILSGSSEFLGNLQSDLGSFITDPQSYYTNDQLNKAMDTRTALQRAQEANRAFQNDFSLGGWNGWLALTQRDQNNPLGFTMLASQSLADQMAFETQNVKDELMQNGGFLSQKICTKWQEYNTDGKPKYTGGEGAGLTKSGLAQSWLPVFSKTPPKQCFKPGGDCCIEWKTITPGSIIRNKTEHYLNSPDRQLELAKTINDSLNALFSVLISKLEGGGLAGLSDSWVNKTNWTDTMNTFTSSDGNTPSDNGGAYDNFNLTRDLGNTYIHSTLKSLGTWNASTNLTNSGGKLYPDLAPGYYNDENKFVSYGNNTYYTVTTAGNTKLILEGYNGWAVGDRAFWDGIKWQNWKAGQANPIKKRGVIQIQNDYIVAAKEILGILPSIMPKLGKLDYCIPGPNPSYETNSTEAQSAYQDWIGSMFVGMKDSTGLRFGVSIDKPGDRTFDNLQSIYTDNPKGWGLITKSMIPLVYTFSNICNDNGSTWFQKWILQRKQNCTGDYFWVKNGELSAEDSLHLQGKTDIMNAKLDYVNNNLFQNFYEVFDKMMNKLYFNNMTNKYSEKEYPSTLTTNEAYIPMAESGLGLTKNILYYNNDIAKATQGYTDAIAQAKINIAKLEPIKAEVSGIIKAAQDRRNKELEKNLGLPLKEIQTKYASCFAEENIQFFDVDDITKNTGVGGAERCSDGIDNDLNGLIDKKDPACQNVITTGTGTGTIQGGGGSSGGGSGSGSDGGGGGGSGSEGSGGGGGDSNRVIDVEQTF